MRRTTGPPASANGASSFHLWWEPEPPRDATEVSVVLRVVDEPRHDRLVVWALQVEFATGPERHGGAHVGLQWNSRHPRNRAVNWGGYDAGGRILPGSVSPLPSAPADPNTRDFQWEPGVEYRLTVRPGAEPGSWSATVTDLSSGVETHIRELAAGGTVLRRPVVWSEVFAHCDDPSVTVVWSDPRCVGPAGSWTPRGYRVSYQDERQGGCSNTDVRLVPGGVAQVTATERAVAAGSVVPIVGQGVPGAGR